MEITGEKYIIKKQNKFFTKAMDKNTQVILKKFFGFVFQYAKGSYYKDFVSFLEYLKPCGMNIDEKIVYDFLKKSKKYKIKTEIYLKDLEIFRNIVENINPSTLPKASGKTRKTQIRELDFTKEILSDIEKNTDIKPFMDDGTLLGAVRHKGFIPWDDDFDFSLMRDDFEKLEEYFKTRYKWIDTRSWTNKHFNKRVRDILHKNPNDIICLKRPTSMKCFKLIDNKVTFCDFFALDYYNDNFDTNLLNKYISQIKKQYLKLKNFSKIFDFYRSEINKNENIVKNSNVIYAGIDNYDFYYYPALKVRHKDDIFPLKKMLFEDTEFWAPNNEIACLESIYENYRALPLFISIEQHKTDQKCHSFIREIVCKN